MQKEPNFFLRLRLRKSFILLVALLGCWVSGLSWEQLHRRDLESASAQFNLLANQRAIALQHEFQEDVEALHSLADFYASSKEVDPEEFRTFAAPLLERHPSLLALEWARRVTPEQRKSFERQVSTRAGSEIFVSEIGTNGYLETASPQPIYFPVEYVVQRDGEAYSLGLNHYSEPPRRTAIDAAWKLGEPVASQQIQLVRVKQVDNQQGVLVAMPVYGNGLPSDTTIQRWDNLAGFVFGVFRVSDVVAASYIALMHDKMRLEVVDVTDSEPTTLSASRNTSDSSGGNLKRDITIPMMGRQWLLHFQSTPEFLEARSTSTPEVSLGFGLLLTALLVLYLSMLERHQRHIEAQVRQRTLQLQATNDKLALEVEERKQAEVRLERHAEELSAANRDLLAARHSLDTTIAQLQIRNRELDEFTYVASHDLQEPLRKLTSFSELLQVDLGGDLNENAANDLRFIVDAATRMRALVQSLLALSRTGRSELRQERVALADCVQQALQDLELRIEEVDAQIVCDELPTVLGDRTLLTQLFQNLIGNALKFCQGRPEIHVTSEHVGEEVHFGVKDNGIGIAKEHADRIFQPFQRLHRRDEYSGTGIGLSICRKAVERHGGKIWIESEPGHGTHFKFTLPIPLESDSCLPALNPAQENELASC